MTEADTANVSITTRNYIWWIDNETIGALGVTGSPTFDLSRGYGPAAVPLGGALSFNPEVQAGGVWELQMQEIDGVALVAPDLEIHMGVTPGTVAFFRTIVGFCPIGGTAELGGSVTEQLALMPFFFFVINNEDAADEITLRGGIRFRPSS